MMLTYPVLFNLKDGTHVVVNQLDDQTFDFHLTRLNSEKHNFNWIADTNEIEESYETRFDQWQNESIDIFRSMLQQDQAEI
jgi:membrane carboxypeptidase/penicillin-binding protein PbpC